jgi:hypothetical protein
MTRDRWAGFPRAEASLACSGGTHRVRWEGGELRLLDHADPEGERALAALGGEPCPCVETLDSWIRHARDPRVLVLGSRGTGDQVFGPDSDPNAAARQQMLAQRATRIRGRGMPAPVGDPETSELERLVKLLSLGGGLDRRLIAQVAGDHRDDPPPPALDAALYGRVLSALRGWLGRGDLELELEGIPDGTRPSLTTGDGNRLHARLPFGWIVDVWGRELEVVWGRFCLRATSEDGVDWELLTVGPDLGEPAVIRVALPR